MSRLLALSLLVSTALAGCGGSGGSDGGGTTPPAPAKKYTFEFVKLSKGSQSDCTVFDGLEQNFDTKYFAYNANPQRIEIHDSDGKYSKSLTPENNEITFTVDDVPDGGYVSIIDYRAGSPNYQVLSIQKALLGDYLIRLNGGSTNTCYSKDKAAETKSGFASILPASGTLSNQYKYETALVSTAKMDNVISVDISAYANEKIFVKGYNSKDDSLVSYGFVSELTEFEDENQTKLTAVNTDFDWSTDFSLSDLDRLAISIKKDDYTYPWIDASFNNSGVTKFPYSNAEPEWLYTATGTTLNWDFKHNAAFTDSLDISLMVNIDSDVAASISNNGTSYVFLAPGISATNELVQRSYYYTQNTTPANTSLTHVIYSVANSDNEVIIPDLKLANLSPADAVPSAIVVTMISANTQGSDFVESFMRSFQPIDPDVALFPMTEDSISLLLSPSDELKQRQYTKMHDYTIVER